MDSKNGNEMEQIQRGLEEFLQKELSGSAPAPDKGRPQERASGYIPGNSEFRGSQDRIRIIGRSEQKEIPREQRERLHIIGQPEEDEDAEDWDSPSGRPRPAGGNAPRGEDYPEEEEIPVRRAQPAGRKAPGGRVRPRGEEYFEEEGAPARRERTARGEAPRRRTEARRPRGEEYFEEEGAPVRRERPHTVPKKKAPAGKAPGKKKKAKAPEEEPLMAKKKTKPRKKKHRLRKLLIAVVLLAVLAGAGWYGLVGMVYGKMNYGEIPSQTGLPMQEDGVVNILLIGNDSRSNGEDGRSDAMILLSISSKTKKIYMTSLLRDMYVKIPGYQDNRLNAAYSYGGAELLMETVEENFDIPVNRYIQVNFEGFANLVDAAGGVELELTPEEVEYVNGYLVEYNILTDRPQGTDNLDPSVSGLIHLNGPQALAFSRNRYLGTDFRRTERQREVMTAVIKKLPKAALTNMGGLTDGLLPNLTTNLTKDECFRLSLMAGKLITYDIVSDSIPQTGTWSNATIRDMQVLQVDFDANIQYLKEKLYGTE